MLTCLFSQEQHFHPVSLDQDLGLGAKGRGKVSLDQDLGLGAKGKGKVF